MTMRPTVHLRDPDEPTMAICGVGYPWPSTVALRAAEHEVDCDACLARAKEFAISEGGIKGLVTESPSHRAPAQKITMDVVDLEVEYARCGSHKLRLTASVDLPELRALQQKLNDTLRFECAAVIHHGPGSQSRTKCERTDPHGPDDEHHAHNPMCPGFEWTGAEGWGNR